jgi:homoserine kinase
MVRLVADHVTVRVPATSGNLGPGFDSFGIALGLHDVVEVRAVTGETSVEVEGEGAGEVPDGEDHLVVRAIRAGLEYVGAPQAGLALRCVNAIPHGRGLGSSAAAVVAGLVAARALVSEPEALDPDSLLSLATEFEGHPDNAAPALLGGATIAWDGGAGPVAVRLPVLPTLAATVLVPTERLSTSAARAALPATVPHRDAATNAGRAGLLTFALTERSDLLLAATQDRLHQHYRAPAMPASVDLVDRLRERSHAAVVSGAGPSVLVLRDGESPRLAADVAHVAGASWQVLELAVEAAGAQVIG